MHNYATYAQYIVTYSHWQSSNTSITIGAHSTSKPKNSSKRITIILGNLTAFGMRLNDEQVSLVRSDIAITNDDKVQFFLEQMYESNIFDKMEMTNWENQPVATKTDFDIAREYFEKLIKLYDTYKQNAGASSKILLTAPTGSPMSAMNYESISTKSPRPT
jgi:hypothetical protein